MTGMTCGMCSAHIERKLNKIAGVRASADFPTATATIDADSTVSVAELCDIIDEAGYHAELRSERPRSPEDPEIPGGTVHRITSLARLLRWGRSSQGSTVGQGSPAQ
ncbi:hypothetical protein BST33_11160 [Mycolicibacter minnesotensis]|uniref:HMA domain-containing protein n=1 Tax=Mycolicibacter minnesotensis TaxID=1118379 RepID=A0AA91M561_9MYCO|nr:hypothetical protein BST33_11160 [Mycolicibacter minnesotensis]